MPRLWWTSCKAGKWTLESSEVGLGNAETFWCHILYFLLFLFGDRPTWLLTRLREIHVRFRHPLLG
ncbi:hypothetical protein LINPERHAP2_LOCUS14308 [Linum perenne]